MLKAFNSAMKHRGPDGVGYAGFNVGYVETRTQSSWRLGLGHQRLSILDLSDAGSQPMFSHDRKLAIVYNGEVYNYIEIAEELKSKGVEFSSHCDTEVVLEAYRYWGEECVDRFNGMWSFVIFDRDRERLFVSRDRFGIKPLYYVQKDGWMAFGSEIKQFLQLPWVSGEINQDACFLYLENGYENPPQTFYKEILQFPAASSATIDLNRPVVEPHRFWLPEEIEPRTDVPDNEAIKCVSTLFRDAIRLRLRSDVPVGSCLSGGLDSSAIFMNMGQLEPEQTFAAFSSCFQNDPSDERQFMEPIVQATNSNHIKVFPENEDFVTDFDQLLWQHDEPIGSVSMYAQNRVMRAAREQGIPVLLDGQGGDELFSGYWPTYFLLLNMYKNQRRFGKLFTHGLGAAMPTGNYRLLTESFGQFAEYRRRMNLTYPFALREDRAKRITEQKESCYTDAIKMTPQEYRLAELFSVRLPRLLKWEDRNSMAYSIESRVPFLDVHLVEYILSISPEMNMRSGWTKYLFRKAMNPILPKEICWRKDKMGFETPQGRWMKHGAFHQHLLDWSNKMEHPVSDYIETPFLQIHDTIKSTKFDTTSMFRLYCLDRWLEAQ